MAKTRVPTTEVLEYFSNPSFATHRQYLALRMFFMMVHQRKRSHKNSDTSQQRYTALHEISNINW